MNRRFTFLYFLLLLKPSLGGEDAYGVEDGDGGEDGGGGEDLDGGEDGDGGEGGDGGEDVDKSIPQGDGRLPLLPGEAVLRAGSQAAQLELQLR